MVIACDTFVGLTSERLPSRVDFALIPPFKDEPPLKDSPEWDLGNGLPSFRSLSDFEYDIVLKTWVGVISKLELTVFGA